MNAPSLPGEYDQVYGMLYQVVTNLRAHDVNVSGFLDGLLFAWE